MFVNPILTLRSCVVFWYDRDNVTPQTADYILSCTHVNKFRKCSLKELSTLFKTFLLLLLKTKQVYSYASIRGTPIFFLMSRKWSASWFISSSWVLKIKHVEVLRVSYLCFAFLFSRRHFHLTQSNVILTGMRRHSKNCDHDEFILLAISPSLCFISLCIYDANIARRSSGLE